MGSNEGEPNGAAETGPALPLNCKLLGRCGFRCFFTPIGPIPGPPPPCGIQKVLCKFKWLTSPPMSPGLDKPTMAFMLAPSM